MTATKKPKQEANELVEMFLPKVASDCERAAYCDKPECVFEKLVWCKVEINKAIDVAILHVERLIEVLDALPYISFVQAYNINQHYQQVLQILKDKK